MPRSTGYGYGKGKGKGKLVSQAQREHRKETKLKRKQERRAKKASHRRAKATKPSRAVTEEGIEERTYEREEDIESDSEVEEDGEGMHGALTLRPSLQVEKERSRREKETSGGAEDEAELGERGEDPGVVVRVDSESEDEEMDEERGGDFGALTLRGPRK